MDPEKQHAEVQLEWQKNIAKTAGNMARVRYTVIHDVAALDFKVYMQIWQDDDWDYIQFLEFCKKLTVEQVELNTNSYKAMADQLYLLIAKEMPSRNIWICINNGDIGIS